MASDLRVPLGPILDAFGVPAVVMRPAPNDEPIATTIVWDTPLEPDVPTRGAFPRVEQRRVMLIPKADLATVPTKSVVLAAELIGGETKRWQVDATLQPEPDATRVIVVPVLDEAE